jgi:hypothetical protein
MLGEREEIWQEVRNEWAINRELERRQARDEKLENIHFFQ